MEELTSWWPGRKGRARHTLSVLCPLVCLKFPHIPIMPPNYGPIGGSAPTQIPSPLNAQIYLTGTKSQYLILSGGPSYPNHKKKLSHQAPFKILLHLFIADVWPWVHPTLVKITEQFVGTTSFLPLCRSWWDSLWLSSPSVSPFIHWKQNKNGALISSFSCS